MKEFYEKCEVENQRQLEKWGEQNHSVDRWMNILTEEVGEAAKAVVEHDGDNLEEELIQVAAVCAIFYEAMQRIKVGEREHIRKFIEKVKA